MKKIILIVATLSLFFLLISKDAHSETHTLYPKHEIRFHAPETPDLSTGFLYIGRFNKYCEPYSPWDCTAHVCPTFLARALLRFDVGSDILNEEITSTSLHLYQPDSKKLFGHLIRIYPVSKDSTNSDIPDGPYEEFLIGKEAGWHLHTFSNEFTISNSPSFLLVSNSEETYLRSLVCSSTPDLTTKPICPENPEPRLIITTKGAAKENIDQPPQAPQILDEPATTMGTSNTIYWIEEEPLEYQAEMSGQKDFSNSDTIAWTTGNSVTFSNLLAHKEYFYRIRSRNDHGKMSEYSKTISSKQLPVKKINKEREIANVLGEISSHDTSNEVQVESQAENVAPTSTASHSSSVRCIIEYDKTRTSTYHRCKTNPPMLESVIHTEDDQNRVFSIQFEGSFRTHLAVEIRHIRCKPPTLIDPISWFSCRKEITKVTTHTVEARNEITPFIIPTRFSHKSIQAKQGINHFSGLIQTLLNFSGRYIGATLDQKASLRIDNAWIDIYAASPISNKILLQQPAQSHPTKPLSFVFGHPVGVTQWHGYTAFQSPHTGIDFGTGETHILAPSNGTIVAAEWDNNNGPCLSGGNIVVVKHDNGFHTAYFHLKDLLNPSGSSSKVGNRISKGKAFATSGNTGSWNCQPLGYHLHYEVRTGRSQATHVDPVPYTDVDWSTIPTLGWHQFPGRLSGDNPHPTY